MLDRRLQRAGIDYTRLTPVDRLSAVGRTGMGALSYIPELPDDQKQQAVTDLDWFADQVELVQTEMDIADIDRLQGAQGGSGCTSEDYDWLQQGGKYLCSGLRPAVGRGV
ncbi:hypothetical protein [Rhizobium sp. AN88]|uniref:hypothetical protein n=1 Tax=Rhizobium sp. AN88 TaxID=3035215 RepID=UPI002B262EE9|nr:hypothetical protein [Rhizobium sp. AN88]